MLFHILVLVLACIVSYEAPCPTCCAPPEVWHKRMASHLSLLHQPGSVLCKEGPNMTVLSLLPYYLAVTRSPTRDLLLSAVCSRSEKCGLVLYRDRKHAPLHHISYLRHRTATSSSYRCRRPKNMWWMISSMRTRKGAVSYAHCTGRI